MCKIKLINELYQRVKRIIKIYGDDLNGTGEYVIDKNINGTQYDFTVSFDDTNQEIEVIEGFTLIKVDGCLERDRILPEMEIKELFEIIMKNIHNNA